MLGAFCFLFNRCAICQVEFDEGETVLLLPCKHLYHKPCIDPWLADNKVSECAVLVEREREVERMFFAFDFYMFVIDTVTILAYTDF